MFAQSDIEKQRDFAQVKVERDHKSFLREAYEKAYLIGFAEGLEIGEFVGRIRAFQWWLNQPVAASNELAKLPIAELQTLADSLQQLTKK